MIKNERQYRITRAQVHSFERALAELHTPKADVLNPLLRKIHQDAIRSQLNDLQMQLNEYEQLRSGKIKINQLETFAEIPNILIKARIASGLTQKQLAERLGLKEQQIQRYEATGYRSANFARLLDVIKNLGIEFTKGISLPENSLDKMFKKLRESGLDYNLLTKRFIPPHLMTNIEKQKKITKKQGKESLALQIASIIYRVFGWTIDDLIGPSPLQFDMAVAGLADFKIPSRVEEQRFAVYTLYAHYLANLIADCTSPIPQSIPTDPSEVERGIRSRYGAITFENGLRYVWDLGIPVLPLNDPGAFHGACWRIDGRNIIVLKHQIHSQARWLFDLLHELRHAAQNPKEKRYSVVETDPISQERRDSTNEQIASQFAGDVVLSGRARELAKICVQEAKGSVELLKAAVLRVAKRYDVPVDSLANYMAFRLSLQNINWWGAASNLQVLDSNPWLIARDFLLNKGNFGKLNEIDKSLLMQALSGSGGLSLETE